MEGIVEPLGRPLHQVLRRAVLDLVTAEPRRSFPPVVHVGWPGATQVVFPARPDSEVEVDHALRCDVMAALLARARRESSTPGAVPMVWLTRPGELVLGDVDSEWLAAARAAAAEAGVELTLVVVTRGGWIDPRSGVRREWKRLRAS